ncbi:AAA family ATPase [Geobacter sp. SVR]|uniref:cytidylate kinase-like family protein n=1 Tax=Geobacter sp. SVR TaxID=2495594 RepID=UPI00143EFBFB|nr:cytidylate kinase-like family protein [Geobacter sp. SVR]BCS52896.1 cytidylate kinase [Geobacter sp. SVR]GCF87518.1 cytidylate kinase [Geobacter sp. SVR]
MPATVLTPSVEQRLRAYHELSGRARTYPAGAPTKPTVTLSREFGCEAFPVAEELVKLAEKTTGEQWLLADISLLDAVAKEHHISSDVMLSLGHKPRWLDDMFATLSPHWKTDSDYYRLLCEQVVMIATAGNAIFVGLGAAIITQSMRNCYHFRLIAEQEFRVRSIARRMQISKQEAEIVVVDKQKEREKVIRKLLDADEQDPLYYHAIFNNGKIRNRQIAATIADVVFKRLE